MENEIDILDVNKMEIITNEIFYDELIKALKSDEKVFNLKDVSIKGDIRISEIYERIKDDNDLKHLILILSEENKTIVYLDVDIRMEGVIFENVVDFRHLDDNTICVKFKKVEFKNCIFKKNINFVMSKFEGNVYFFISEFEGNANFTESIFEGNANFDMSKFEGNANFTESIFEGYVNFESIFKGNAKFTGSIFEKDTSFRHSEFEKDADFWNSKFKGNADFCTKFKGNTYFTMSIFEGNVKFTGSIFEKDTDFRHSKFERDADFTNAIIEGNVNFINLIIEENANFIRSTFEKDANFMHSKFEGNTNFDNSTFKGVANFDNSTFKGVANFKNSTFNNIYFLNSIFNAMANFLDISYKLLSFKECTFESTTYFKNKEKEKQMPAFFNLINFKNANNTTFTDFSLSTTSFILTDVKDIVIISDASKNEKIFDEMLLEITPKEKLEKDELKKKLKENMEKNKLFSDKKFLSDDFIEKVIDISPYLRHETVLKEYRDIRKSFEKHRTYSEASNLFIREMDLIKENSDMPKKIIFNLYKYISGYGESIWLPLKWSIIFIFLFPIIAISFAYLINSVLMYLINPILIYLNNHFLILYHFLIFYVDTLEQVLRVFFQLKMSPSENVLFITEWEWFIRVVSLILLTNITLALVKQLKRR